ncbi:haloacid dehalogenase-like hydrolase [Aquirhabdus parva]|uniref:HAD family hydrolase n=1 Tax=Aquirhabdus parva TaxID=2283318 RepID=A0A345P5T8_9GAMM|nr:haloacid dehalogenase-like hydrolase [Aquirhabdus parva]AXI02647.1 HAD family hydrolase [Aquirhabdus parva]
MSKIVVFDLDKTLLAVDSTETWIREQIFGSPYRFAMGVVSAPLGLMLMHFPEKRKFGASIFLWIATVGLNESQKMESIEQFNQRFHAGLTKSYWFKDGIAVLEEHIQNGHKVIIVTAAPKLLAEKLFEPWKDEVAVIGSTVRALWGGWISDRLCRHSEKCNFLMENGFGVNWDFAYSDSEDDIPILAAAEKAYLINASRKTTKRVQRKIPSLIENLVWK